MGAGYDGSIVINSKLDNKEFMSNSKQLLQAIKSLQSTAKSMGAGMASSATGYGAAIKKDISSAKELKAEIANLTRVAANMRKELNDSGTRSGAKQFLDLRDKLKQAEKAYDAALKKQNQLEQTKGINSQAFKNAAAETDRLGERIDSIKSRLDSIRTSNREILRFRESEQEVQKIEVELQGLRGQLRQVQTEAAETRLDDTGLKEAFHGVATAAGRAAASIARIAGSAALSFLGKLASSAKNAAIQLAKLASGAIIGGLNRIASGVKKAASALLSLTQHSKNSNNSFKRGFTTILKYGLGIRSLYYLFRKIRAAISEAFTEMAKYDPQIKASLSSLQAALNGLKGSLATAFAPIFTAIAPALTYLINMLTAAMNTLGAFFAALTGHGFFKKAVGVAKSVGGSAGKGAKSAKKEVKELKRELLGFDELNVLSGDKDNSGSGGGGGGGGGGAGYKFIDQKIPDEIQKFVDTLKDLWKKGQYEKIGRLVGKQINKMLQKIYKSVKWDNIRKKWVKRIDAFTGIFNGIVKSVDWTLLGQTIAEGINSFIEIITRTIEQLDFTAAGIALASAINGIFSRGDLFTKAATALSNGIKGILNLGKVFLEYLNEEQVAQDIKNAFETGIDWDGIAKDTWEVIKLAFKKAGNFLNALLGGGGEGKTDISKYTRPRPTTIKPKYTIDDSVWDELADNLANGFNSAIEKLTVFINGLSANKAIAALAGWIVKFKNGINWEGVGALLGSAMRIGLEAISAAVTTFKDNAATDGKNLADALNAIIETAFPKGESSLGTTFSNAVKGTFDFISAFLEQFDEVNLAEKIKTDVDWDGIAQAAFNAFKAAVEKLGNFLTVIFGGDVDVDASGAKKYARKRNGGYSSGQTSWTRQEDIFGDNLGGQMSKLTVAILDAIKAAFGQIPWDEWGGRIHTFLVDEIEWKEIFESILGLFIEALSGIQDLIFAAIFGEDFKNNKVFQALFPAQSLAYTLKDVLGKPDVQAAVDDVVSNAVDKYTVDPEKDYEKIDTGSLIGDLVEYFVNGVKENIPLASDSYDENGRPISEDLVAVAKSLQEMGYSTDEIIAGLAKTEEEQTLLREALALSAQAIEDNTTATEEFDWSGWEEIWDGSDVSGEVDVKVNTPDGASTTVEAGEDLADGIKTGVENKQDELDQSMTDASDGMNTAFEDAEGISSPSKVFEEYGNMIVDGLILGLGTLPEKLQGIWNTLPEWAKTMFANLGNTLGIDIKANVSGGDNTGGGQPTVVEDSGKSTKVTKKDIKETQKNTKELKKNTAKRGEVDVNYEGAGFDTSGDKPKLNVGVQFAPEGEEPTEDNTNSGLLGWLQELLNADTVEAKVALIKDGWTTIKNFLGVDENTPIGVLLDLLKNNWTTIRNFLGIPENSMLDVLIQALLNNWPGILKALGIPEDATIATVVKAAVQAINDLFDALGIPEDSPLRLLLDLIKGAFDDDVEKVLGSDGQTIQTFIELVKKGFTTLLKFIGIDSDSPLIQTAIQLVRQGFTTFLGFLGIDTSSPVIQAIVNLLTGEQDAGAKTALEAKDKDVDVDVDLNRTGNMTTDEVQKVDGLEGGTTQKKYTFQGAVSGALTYANALVAEELSGGSKTKNYTFKGSDSGGMTLDKAQKAQNLSGGTSEKKYTFNGLLAGLLALASALVAEGLKGGSVTKNYTYSGKTSGSLSLNDAEKADKLSGGTNTKSYTATVNKKGNMDVSDAVKVDKLSGGNATMNYTYKGSKNGKLTPDEAVKLSNISSRNLNKTVTIKATLIADKKKVKVTQAGTNTWQLVGAMLGGYINSFGNLKRFASGGAIMRNGRSSWWNSVNKYAAGTTRAHGTMFVAGENGPEIIGHVNGRTEILNKSQLADAMYGAVVSGMSAAVNALGAYIGNRMSTCTNAIVQTIGNWAEYLGMNFYSPAMANGGIMPYDVAMQIARSTQELQNTLDANNEDLIQALVSAMGNAANSIVTAMQRNAYQNNINRSAMTTGHGIDDINRTTLMFGKSPLKGV